MVGVVRDGKIRGYVLSHPKLNEYFAEEMNDDERTEWQDRFLDYGKAQLQALDDKSLAAKEASPYIVEHYGAHLERADAPAEDLYALVSEG